MILITLALLTAAQMATVSGEAAAKTHPLERVAVVGASASAGWGVVIPVEAGEPAPIHHAHIDLTDTLAAALPTSAGPVMNLSDASFFTRPIDTGQWQVAEAVKRQATMLVGIDFLFWYGYGHHTSQGTPHTAPDTRSRLAMLELGLAQLDRFQGPIVIGDLPDVSDAVDVRPISLLSESQVPSNHALDALNGRIREWADARKRATLVPLAAAVAAIKASHTLDLGSQTMADTKGLLQFDELHPSDQGLLAITLLVTDAMEAHLVGPMPNTTLSELRDRVSDQAGQRP